MRFMFTHRTPGSDPGNEISSENENAQPTSIVEAEENIDKASEAVKQKADNLSKIKDEVEYDKKAKAVSDTSDNLASSTKLLEDKNKAAQDADTNLKNAQSKQAEAKEAYDKAVAEDVYKRQELDFHLRLLCSRNSRKMITRKFMRS